VTGPIRPHPLLAEHYVTLDEKPGFIQLLFDDTARNYDCINRLFALGLGGWYRRRILRQSGLRPGVRLLDVAIGTGLIARAALRVTGYVDVIGLDVSQSMLAEARRALNLPLIQGSAEQLPVANESVDFVSMGYALRHVSDLSCAFQEFWRVLRPGGALLLLEIGRPDGELQHRLAAWYLGRVVPLLCRCLMPRTRSATLMRYFWDTIEHCVPQQVIVDQLVASGFIGVECDTSLGLFRGYSARKADQDSVDTR
jgi:demethylmenaquinone methyltransferase/2-methoxy-6-polyprenyl-1,4-benzoquinol methylase